MNWLAYGHIAMNFASIAGGATYLPPEVLKISLIRPVTVREPVGIDGAHIPGAQPAVVGERVRRFVGQLVIAVHHSAAADLNFPSVAVDAYRGTVEGQADGAQLVVIGPVDARPGRGLGQAVALQDQQARGMKPLADVAVQRCRAGDEE